MTRDKMLEYEDKIYEAVRKVYGYNDEANDIIDALMEAMDEWFSARIGAELKVKEQQNDNQ